MGNINSSTSSNAALLPPQNLEAEASVLGSLLLDKDAIVKIADIIKPADFYKDAHRIIFEVILELYEDREPIDVLSLSNRLKERKELDRIGGSTFLTDLVNQVPTAAHVVNYAQIVARKATLRNLIKAAADISSLAYTETDEISSILDQSEKHIFNVSQKHLRQNFTPLRSLLTETFERIDELHKNKDVLRGAPTGYRDLDNLLAGLQQSNLIILAARPSMGKTSLALDIARNVALKANLPVGIFSLEMSKEELVDRLLASESGVDLWKLRTGKLVEGGNVNDFDQLGAAMDKLSRSQIFIDDTPGANAMEIRTKARRLQSEHGLGLVIVDYLQLMEGTNTENRVQEISEISRALKGIARELKVPVLALSQLSRAVEQRTPQIPQLSDLRESGSIEQDADVVMFIYREELYKPETPRKRIAEIHVRKHRNGPTGIIELFFDATRVSFKNLDTKHGGQNYAPVGANQPNVASWTKNQAAPQQPAVASDIQNNDTKSDLDISGIIDPENNSDSN